MGNNVTEGAIIQHLAKVRARRVQKNKTVPPPLRRGGVGSAASCKESEAPATPDTPGEGLEYVATNRAKRSIQPTVRTEKRSSGNAVHDDVLSGSDEEWTSNNQHRSNKHKNKRSHKKRKSTPPAEHTIDDRASEPDLAIGQSIESSPDTKMVAVGARFLDFLGNGELKEEPRAEMIAKSEDELETKQTLIVKLRLGASNLGRLMHKGTGVYQDRDPEKRWKLPSPGPNGEKWGFSRDYYGPIPKAGRHSHNPGLLRGEWPLDVALRQYDAPQAATWGDETYEPDPRLVHPARYLDDPNCAPQLRLHRKLRTNEESNASARILDQELPAYRSYVETHRELPPYYDPSLNTVHTVHETKLDDNYKLQDFSTTNVSSSSNVMTQLPSSLYQPNGVNGFDLPRSQIEDGMNTHQNLESKYTGTIDDHVDRHQELPPGKIFDVDSMLGENIIEEAKSLDWWQD